jgi:N4-gp56 family major capsid protein
MRFTDTQFLTANRLTEERWPETFFEYTLENMVLSKFVGSDSNSIIQTDKNLTKKAADKITMRLRMPLSNAGGYDDSDLEGNEEAMSFYNFPVEIHERGNAVRSAGKMTEKRTKINIRREATEALSDWAGEQLDNDFVYALSGLGNQGTYVGEGTSNINTVNEHAPSTNRILYIGQTAAGVVTSATSDATLGDGGASDYANYFFGTKIISIAKRKAILASPKMRPIRIRGQKYYVMLLHPWQVKALRLETGDHGWQVIQSRAGVRGLKNPLFQRMFDDAIGIYDNVILYEYERIQTRVAGEVFDSGDTIDSNIVDGTAMVCRALFLGAQAGCLAWGQMPKRYEKDFDYNRKPGTATDMIYGVSKTVFNDPGANQNTNTAQDDYAVICVDTCAADD